MATRIVEGQLPYSGGTGIGIDTNKVISVLLREEDNLIQVNGDNELYTDLQLAVNITPSSDFPVGVTVGKVLAENGWSQNGLILNWKTTSGDYARWLYGADGKIYFDGGQGTWKQVYYSEEVDALFTALRGELATVAFTGDYNDLINRPAFLQVQADWNQTDSSEPDYIKNKPTIPTVNDATLTIQKNGTAVATFTANSSTNATANITVPSVIDNVTSTSTSDALSANQGKSLQDQINDLKAMGRFLSLWDCETGQPISFPLDIPYNYQTGDYFLVENVDTTTNYRPSGVQYTGSASTTPETDEVEVGDMYIYDGQIWLLQINHGKTVSFANLSGQPSDNANLASALNAKANVADLATVATTGDYDDLTNKPTIPAAQVNSDWNANSGVAQILNKPTIPTDTNQLTNGAGYQTANDVSTSISTAIAGKADATDLNTKTFYLSSTSDLTTAQAAYDWYKAGKNPIIVYNKKAYILTSYSTTGIKFYRAGVDYKDVDDTKSGTALWYIYFSASSDTVTSITNASEVLGGYYLRTGKNYSTPYTPEYDGSPATKKYVDDHSGLPAGGQPGQMIMMTSNGAKWFDVASPTAISLDESSIQLNTAGATQQLTATVTPSTAIVTQVDWSSSDTTIATVSSSGLVTCVTPGNATITASTVNGLTATCGVTKGEWQPGVNTIAYFPLDTDLLDHSGNSFSVTQHGNVAVSTVGGVSAGYFGGLGDLVGSYTYNNTSLTTLGWMYKTANPNADNASMFGFGKKNLGGPVLEPMYFNTNGPSEFSNKPGVMLFNYDPMEYISTGCISMNNNERVHFAATYDVSTRVCTLYVNGIQVGQYTSSTTNVTNMLGMSRKADMDRSWKGYMSNVIFEDKCWSAQEVSDYFDQTKANYGIS